MKDKQEKVDPNHKRTLWDRLSGQNAFVPNEKKYHNPFDARIGNTLHLDILEHRGIFFVIKAIEEINRGTGVMMADYHIAGKKFGESEDRTLILRTVPRDGKCGKEKVDFRIVALTEFFSCGWDDDARPQIMEGCNDNAGEFVINPNTIAEQKYWRIGDRRQPYENVKITSLKDDDGNGIVEDCKIETRRMDYWDFSRTTQDAGGEFNEYLFVQKDRDTGYITILMGREIPPERINI